jgi:hypothetical protein
MRSKTVVGTRHEPGLLLVDAGFVDALCEAKGREVGGEPLVEADVALLAPLHASLEHPTVAWLALCARRGHDEEFSRRDGGTLVEGGGKVDAGKLDTFLDGEVQDDVESRRVGYSSVDTP